MKTHERILWFLVVIVISAGSFYENSKSICSYIKQSKRLSHLSRHHWEVKQELKQTKEELKQAKQKVLFLNNAGRQLLEKCKYIARECDNIIKNKKNCGFSADYLRRP